MRSNSCIHQCVEDATTSAHATKTQRKHTKKSRIPADDFRAIMQANARFYSAFSSLDMAAMETVWLNDTRCICHFPGMKRLTGYEKILKSFRIACYEMDGAMRRNWMEPEDIQIEFQTGTKATVFCNENMYSITARIVDGQLKPESELIKRLSATNAFKKVDGKWHMWYHQASPFEDCEEEFRLRMPATDAPGNIEKAVKEVQTPRGPPAMSYSDMTMSQTFDSRGAPEHKDTFQLLSECKFVEC